jgi:hypothetical protein
LGASRSSAKLPAFAKEFHLQVNSVLASKDHRVSREERRLNARYGRPARNRSGWRAKVWLVACLAGLVLQASDDARGEPGAKGAVAPTSVTLPPLDPALLGKPLDASWPKRLVVTTDSVLLGATPTLVKSLSDWQVTVVGRSAMMIRYAMEALRQQPGATAPVIVAGLGHNSVWEKDRRNFDRWSATFDKSVEDMLALLRQRGAQKIVWLTLRECSLDVLPKTDGTLTQYREWCWWFPYVNERLRAIKQQHPDMALADWTAVARRPGITYDSIHVNVQGAQLMTALIRVAIGIDAPPAAGPVNDGVQKTGERASERLTAGTSELRHAD